MFLSFLLLIDSLSKTINFITFSLLHHEIKIRNQFCCVYIFIFDSLSLKNSCYLLCIIIVNFLFYPTLWFINEIFIIFLKIEFSLLVMFKGMKIWKKMSKKKRRKENSTRNEWEWESNINKHTQLVNFVMSFCDDTSKM